MFFFWEAGRQVGTQAPSSSPRDGVDGAWNVNKLGVRRCVDAPGDNLGKWWEILLQIVP